MHLPIKLLRVGRTPVNKILRSWSNWNKKGEVPEVKWRRHYRRKSHSKLGAPKPHFSASFTTVLKLWYLNFFFLLREKLFLKQFSTQSLILPTGEREVISWENWGDISQSKIAGPQLWFSYPELKLEVTTKLLKSVISVHRAIVLLPSSLFSPYFWLHSFCLLRLFFI